MADDARCNRNRELDEKPRGLGKRVTGLAYALHAHQSDWLDKGNPHAQARFQNAIEDTFLFVGGRDVAADWNVLRGAKNFVGLFEENLRWRWSKRDTVADCYGTLSRFCIVSARPGDGLADVVAGFSERVAKFDPQNVVYVVGREDVSAVGDADGKGCGPRGFAAALKRFAEMALALRNNTATLQIIKRWPAAPSCPQAAKFNQALGWASVSVNYAINELIAKRPELAARILVVDGGCDTLFTAQEGAQKGYYAVDGLSLTRAGNDRVAQELAKAGWPQVYAQGEAPQSQFGDGPGWTNYAHTHESARPIPWAYAGLSRPGKLTVTAAASRRDRRLRTLTVRVPDGHEGQKVTWMVAFPDAGTHVSGHAALNDYGVFEIADLGTFHKEMLSPFTKRRFANDYVLTVFDEHGRHWQAHEGVDLASGATQTRNRKLSPVQARLMRALADKDIPLTWVFTGDSTDHGANFSRGFDCISEAVAKYVRHEWGRDGDVFVNTAMSGDFSNRAVDPCLLRARIAKYRPDVLSVTLGVSDGVDKEFDGVQRTLTDKEKFKENFRKICTTAKMANPAVIVVVNAIGPTDYVGADCDRRGVPAKYNAWLNELFGPHGETEFAGYVLYNAAAHDEQFAAVSNYPSLYRDGLFFGKDALHPGPNAHLIKARTFLACLGMNMNDTYLGRYLLNERKAAPGLKLPAIEFKVLPRGSAQATSSATVVPDFAGWARAALALPEVAKAGIGQIFLTLVGEDGRVYGLQTALGEVKNRHAFPYLPAGQYSVSLWASLKNLWPDGNAYVLKAPDRVNGLTV